MKQAIFTTYSDNHLLEAIRLAMLEARRRRLDNEVQYAAFGATEAARIEEDAICEEIERIRQRQAQKIAEAAKEKALKQASQNERREKQLAKRSSTPDSDKQCASPPLGGQKIAEAAKEKTLKQTSENERREKQRHLWKLKRSTALIFQKILGEGWEFNVWNRSDKRIYLNGPTGKKSATSAKEMIFHAPRTMKVEGLGQLPKGNKKN